MEESAGYPGLTRVERETADVNPRTPILTGLLREVSRSFYLTLRVLPGAVRTSIGLAYLLARTTDTIADTGIVPVGKRLEALDRLRSRILGTSSAVLDFGNLAQNQGEVAEKILLERCEEALTLLASLDRGDRERIVRVLEIITSGQELDLRRFGATPTGLMASLTTEAELIDYTYRVAGCVGEFWTLVCRAALFPNHTVPEKWMIQRSVEFGQGLQLVNILRDLPRDLRQGRCYLPADGLSALGLAPADLLEPANEKRMRPLYDHYIRRAQSYLLAGWEYTNALPHGQMRVRLACAWPVLIGVRTLDRLRSGRILDPEQRLKITRPEVRQLMLKSILLYPFKGAWRGQFAEWTDHGKSS